MTHHEIDERNLIELYLLKRLEPAEATEFEKHYLTCPECLDRLDREQPTMALLGNLSAADAAVLVPFVPRHVRNPLPAWSLVAAVGVVAVGLSAWLPRPAAHEVRPLTVADPVRRLLPIIELTSHRSDSGPARLKAGPFRLRLDLRGLPPAPVYSVEIVEESGRPAWTRSAIPAAGPVLEVDVEAAVLKPGLHWVRLIGASARLLREYSLLIEP